MHLIRMQMFRSMKIVVAFGQKIVKLARGAWNWIFAHVVYMSDGVISHSWNMKGFFLSILTRDERREFWQMVLLPPWHCATIIHLGPLQTVYQQSLRGGCNRLWRVVANTGNRKCLLFFQLKIYHQQFNHPTKKKGNLEYHYSYGKTQISMNRLLITDISHLSRFVSSDGTTRIIFVNITLGIPLQTPY